MIPYLEIKNLTNDLRNSDDPLWNRLRQLLSEKGIDPTKSFLSYFAHEEPFYDFGVIVADNNAIYQFAFDYLRRDIMQGSFAEWEEITGTFRRTPYREQISAALKLKEKNSG